MKPLCSNCDSQAGGFRFYISGVFTAREATVRKIETIIREQFSLEMKNKEHEIDVISQVCG